MMLPPRNRYWL